MDDDKIDNNIQIDNDNYDEYVESKPWYFAGGKRPPKPAKFSRKTRNRIAKLMPSEDPWSDRITNQLMFVPPNYEAIQESGKHKTILVYNGLGPWNIKHGQDVFRNLKCPVNTCKVTAKRELANQADLILYKDYYIPTGVARPPNQIYMLYFLECPYHTQHVKFPGKLLNSKAFAYLTFVYSCDFPFVLQTPLIGLPHTGELFKKKLKSFYIFNNFLFPKILERIVQLSHHMRNGNIMIQESNKLNRTETMR